MPKNTKQVTLLAVMLMIFTSAFAFDNTSIAYYTMGYSGIIWYVLAALLFFIPSSGILSIGSFLLVRCQPK